MQTDDTVLEWLRKLQKRKESSLMNATKKSNASAAEIDSLLETLDIIENLIDMVESKKGKCGNHG
jgi:hypothetical protein